VDLMMNFEHLISPLKVTALTALLGNKIRKNFPYHFGWDNV